jgi:hypothetical protein
VYLSPEECRRAIDAALPTDEVDWPQLLVPMKQLILDGPLPLSLPGCGELIEVIVCSECLGPDDNGWIGARRSFARHKQDKHANDSLVQAMPMTAQQVLILAKILCI